MMTVRMAVVVAVLMRRFHLVRALGVRAGDPGGVAFEVVLFLPDRQAMLDLVDDVTTGAEGLVAMRGGGADPHGKVADLQVAHAMHGAGRQHAVAFGGLGQDALALGDRQLGVGLVLQAAHFAAVVVVAHPAFERAEAAAAGMLELLAQLGEIGRGRGEVEAHHPPATGGMKTTVSPSASARFQSLNCVLTATLSASIGSEKPWRVRNSS